MLGGPSVTRLRAWFDLDPPASFTYRSYLRYVARAVPRYGLGPALIVVYQVVANGWAMAVYFGGILAAAVLASLVGFAVVRRDYGYAGAALVPTAGVYGALYLLLPSGSEWSLGSGLDSWLVVFSAWFGVIAFLGGVAAGQR